MARTPFWRMLPSVIGSGRSRGIGKPSQMGISEQYAGARARGQQMLAFVRIAQDTHGVAQIRIAKMASFEKLGPSVRAVSRAKAGLK